MSRIVTMVFNHVNNQFECTAHSCLPDFDLRKLKQALVKVSKEIDSARQAEEIYVDHINKQLKLEEQLTMCLLDTLICQHVVNTQRKFIKTGKQQDKVKLAYTDLPDAINFQSESNIRRRLQTYELSVLLEGKTIRVNSLIYSYGQYERILNILNALKMIRDDMGNKFDLFKIKTPLVIKYLKTQGVAGYSYKTWFNSLKETKALIYVGELEF